MMVYEQQGRFGDRIREVYSLLMARIEQCGAIERAESSAVKKITQSLRGDAGERKWEIRIFRKHSWARKRTMPNFRLLGPELTT
jgi:hypothetical protein